MPSPIGYERVYAYLGDRPFNHDNWWDAFRAGRTVATNGPLLFMTVDGKLPGA